MHIQTIDIYFMCLDNPHSIDYFYEVIEEMNRLAWYAMIIRQNVEMSNWETCSPLIGWHGSIVMSPGT